MILKMGQKNKKGCDAVHIKYGLPLSINVHI